MRQPLPIDRHVDDIVELVDARRFAVVVAPPGSGKTTRIPPALVARGPLILLQPRRVAARALARRIAVERGWTVGKEIGWQVRHEKRFTDRTRLLVATEGILTARLQSDPLLEAFRTVVLDEFHERSLHADLALALVRQAARARGDLNVVVMSATLDAGPVAEFLGGCPIVEVDARQHALEIDHAPERTPADACREAVTGPGGHVLCFLPGAPEIRRTMDELRAGLPSEVDLLPLHGSLDADAQDAALAVSSRRKLILATNLAETSLTVDGVDQVIDSGWVKVLRRDPNLGIDRLERERISLDSATQRAGRAGRTGPGRVVRLWEPGLQLRPRREPEIHRVDLAAPFLEVLAWGGDPVDFEWFEPPEPEAARAAMELLRLLGAVEDGRITALGSELRRLVLHPRLGRVLLACDASVEGAAACAALAEGWTRLDNSPTTSSDLLTLADRIGQAPHHVRRAAKQLRERAQAILGRNARAPARTHRSDETLLRAIFAGYPDRVARRREPGSSRLLLANGHGGVLARESGVRDAEFLVAAELRAGARGPGSAAIVHLASRIDPSWLEETRRETVHELGQAGVVRAVERSFHHGIVIAERPVEPDPAHTARMLAERILEQGLGLDSEALLRRLRFAGVHVDLDRLVTEACYGRTETFAPDLAELLPFESRKELERLAPETIRVPSGRDVDLDYRDDGSVVAAVKLQELFGMAESPRIGERGPTVTFSLLAPNGRPVQTTTDLRSFWSSTYAEVRKQLRGRYPKHPWPEDPWTAEPTAGVKRDRRKRRVR